MFTKKANLKEGKINLQVLKEKFDYEIKYLKKYFKLNQSSVSTHKDTLEKSLITEIKNNPEKESQLFEFYDEEIQLITSFYYHSSIVLVYTILENTLTQLCVQIKNETNNRFSIDFLASRDNIGKTKEYLELTTGLEFEKIEKIWPRIGMFQKLRNIIIHQNSTFKNDKESKKMRNMFKDIKISSDNKKFYIKNEKLIDEFICKMEDLINALINDLHSKTFMIIENDKTDDSLPF